MLTRPGTLCFPSPAASEIADRGVLSRRANANDLAKTPHKKTLFDTAAHFRGCTMAGQAVYVWKNGNFANKVKDLAHFLNTPFTEDF